MAPPVLGYRHYIDEYFDEKHLLIPRRSQRRHNREVKIRSRMRFARDCMYLYQPGLYYGPQREDSRNSFPSWFIPGRFAKIHPMRVCSCEMCKGDRDENKRERRKVRAALRREGEDFLNEGWTADW